MASYSVTVNPFGSFSGRVVLAVAGLPAGVAASFAANPVAAGGSTTMTIDTGPLAAGVYDLQMVGTA